MEAKISLDKKFITIESPADFTGDNMSLELSPSYIDGSKSSHVTLSIENKNGANECFLSFCLNKNQARYVANYLKAFVEEDDIDPAVEY